MRFNLKKPCSNCPFLKTCKKGWLGSARAKQIAEDVVLNNRTFTCHKTLGKKEIDQSHCHGALVFLENVQGHNNMLRIAAGLGLYTDIAKPDDAVFDSIEAVADHHDNLRF